MVDRKRTLRGIEDIPLFNGSLAELNSVSSVQYKIVDTISFGCHIPPDEADEIDGKLESVIRTSRYDGLVNRRTSFTRFDGRDWVYVEGTPVVKKEKSDFL